MTERQSVQAGGIDAVLPQGARIAFNALAPLFERDAGTHRAPDEEASSEDALDPAVMLGAAGYADQRCEPSEHHPDLLGIQANFFKQSVQHNHALWLASRGPTLHLFELTGSLKASPRSPSRMPCSAGGARGRRIFS